MRSGGSPEAVHRLSERSDLGIRFRSHAIAGLVLRSVWNLIEVLQVMVQRT